MEVGVRSAATNERRVVMFHYNPDRPLFEKEIRQAEPEATFATFSFLPLPLNPLLISATVVTTGQRSSVIDLKSECWLSRQYGKREDGGWKADDE